MIENILELLLNNDCKNIIIQEELCKKIDKDLFEYIEDNFNITKIEDIRSATFYALGTSYMTEKSSILLIEGEYLPNIYTGITEAWFQKKNIIVIALYNDLDKINSEYLRKCIPTIINIYNNDIEKYKEKIESAVKTIFPVLINIKYINFSNIKINYDEILENLNQFLKEDDELFLYNSNSIKKYNFRIKNIKEEYKYGIISKYMGYVIAKNKKILLCCTDEILKLDLNIFNNRYINNNMKIIILNKENIISEKNIDKWIKNNNIDIEIYKKIDNKKIKDFYFSNKASIILIGGEK